MPKNSKQLLKKDFENIQFPTSHLEAEPFRTCFCKNEACVKLVHLNTTTLIWLQS